MLPTAPSSNQTSSYSGCMESLINDIPYFDLEVTSSKLLQDA